MATTTMTPLEAIAYLHGTLPARPELYEDDEHTAALVALAPLLVAQPESPAQVRSDEAQPLMTGTWPKEQGASTVAMEDVWSGAIGPVEVTSEAQPVEPLFTGLGCLTADGAAWVRVPDGVDRAAVYDQRFDVFLHGSRPAPRKVTAEDLPPASFVVAELSDERRDELFQVLGLNGLTAVVQDVIDAILASKAGA